MSGEYDVVVAGGGIAGLTAALTAQRLGRQTLVLTGPVLGGHLLSIGRVDGYPGFPEGIPGYELCPLIQEQAAAEGAEFAAEQLTGLAPGEGLWLLAAGSESLRARSVVLATGTALKVLGVPGEARLRGRGVSHCASCDGPLLRGCVVAVAGGGDSAMQEALTLADTAARVILLHRGPALSGQAAYRSRVHAHPRIEIRANVEVTEVMGESAVTGIRIRELAAPVASLEGAGPVASLEGAGPVASLEVAAVFVYVGLQPSVDFLGGRLRLDECAGIRTDAGLRTELTGVCAAGSVRSGWPGRAAAAAGDGAAAAIALDRFLARRDWPRSPEGAP